MQSQAISSPRADPVRRSSFPRTLNHDTLIEELLAENDISYIDGFGPNDGDVRWFDERVYDSDAVRIRIIKPHGSVNWFSFRETPYPAMIVGRDLQNCRDKDGKELKLNIKTPAFLSGVNKVLAYNRGIYSEMFYRFHQVLREHEFMAMSGYGWGDTAINFRLMNWLDYDRRNTMMLLHQNPNELADRCLQLAEAYEAFVGQKRIVPVSKWLSQVGLAEVQAVRSLNESA